jgi:pyruvate/2-oxoglutarate dehydrogenase complex dihydrolipoamide acyltransferase (E2) component
MAESITEGTLKTWTKKVGDTVEADEEVATIETDKVCNVSPLRIRCSVAVAS